MPTISLRLTEQEHAELKAWAEDGRRSVQKEIIWRLFTVEGSQAPKVTQATNEPRVAIEVPLGQTGTLPAEGGSKTDLEWLKRRSGKK